MDALKLYPNKSKRPLKAIRYFCLECMGLDRILKYSRESVRGVKECKKKTCALYDFRLGTNPFKQKRELTKGLREQLLRASSIHRDRCASVKNR